MKKKGLLLAALLGLVYIGVNLALGCPIRRVFGVSCPACGLTRASLSLLSGEVSAALSYHPLVFLAWLLIALIGLYLLLGRERRKKHEKPFFLFFALGALLFLLVYILRLAAGIL